MARWQFCNVLSSAKEANRLWHFAAAGDHFKLAHEERKLPQEKLPPKLILKDWQTLVRHRLDLAWLPVDKVFLRVLQLPAENPEELPSMIEFQLEKLSPMPVAQVVWTFEVLPQRQGNLASIVVAVAERRAVEELLGQLEGQGYLADRLEVPFIDQLLATQITDDGVWFFPGGTPATCLVAWFYGGMLHNLTLLHLPATEPGKFVRTQLEQITWAGEFEGWITQAPKWHLVSDPAKADEWMALLREDAQLPVTLVPAPAPSELAQSTARRATRVGQRRNLIPDEFLVRYKQLFVDRMWMQALGAAVVLYLLGVLVYFACVEVLRYQVNGLEARARGMTADYNDSLRVKEEVRVLQNQLKLQYAALDCWKTAVELLPEEIQLEQLVFNQGRRLTLTGLVPKDLVAAVATYYTALNSAVSTNGTRFFSKVTQKATTLRGAGGENFSWTIEAELPQETKE